MVERVPPKLTSLDTNHIVIDIGLVYTKCGFIKDTLPKHIVPTPFSLVDKLRDNIKTLSTTTFADL